jgi:hypothetical protein
MRDREILCRVAPVLEVAGDDRRRARVGQLRRQHRATPTP